MPRVKSGAIGYTEWQRPVNRVRKGCWLCEVRKMKVGRAPREPYEDENSSRDGVEGLQGSLSQQWQVQTAWQRDGHRHFRPFSPKHL
jgi:hypothetical protein